MKNSSIIATLLNEYQGNKPIQDLVEEICKSAPQKYFFNMCYVKSSGMHYWFTIKEGNETTEIGAESSPARAIAALIQNDY